MRTWLLWRALPSLGSFAAKVIFVTVIGLVAPFAISAPHWTWYGFGGGFFFGELIESVVAFAVAGVVLAWLSGRVARGSAVIAGSHTGKI